MQIGETIKRRHIFVDFWVVFHSARAQRIEPGIYAVVFIGQQGIMSDYINLADFRQVYLLFCKQMRGDQVFKRDARDIAFRKAKGTPALS
jgi:histidinol phosphatase-like enzyme